MSVDEIYNALRINENLLMAGQPTEEQLRAIAAEGFTRVINLAPFEPGRSLPDEAELVRALNMEYINIPVIWTDPKSGDFDAFEEVMSQAPNVKTLVHCMANFRVTAFYSLYAQKHLGWSETQADTFRAQIWHGSDYPIWEAFIARTKAAFVL
jgi:protein tyrosine phosphatase (PTP) superfamily phosphohydrolase (DUF442 family)